MSAQLPPHPSFPPGPYWGYPVGGPFVDHGSHGNRDIIAVTVKLASAKDDNDTVSNMMVRSTIRRPDLSDQDPFLTVGEWACQCVQESADWIVKIAKRDPVLRKRRSGSVVITFGDGYDILVVLDGAVLPQDLRKVSRIGVGVCIANKDDVDDAVRVAENGCARAADSIWEQVSTCNQESLRIYLHTDVTPFSAGVEIPGRARTLLVWTNKNNPFVAERVEYGRNPSHNGKPHKEQAAAAEKTKTPAHSSTSTEGVSTDELSKHAHEASAQETPLVARKPAANGTSEQDVAAVTPTATNGAPSGTKAQPAVSRGDSRSQVFAKKGHDSLEATAKPTQKSKSAGEETKTQETVKARAIQKDAPSKTADANQVAMVPTVDGKKKATKGGIEKSPKPFEGKASNKQQKELIDDQEGRKGNDSTVAFTAAEIDDLTKAYNTLMADDGVNHQANDAKLPAASLSETTKSPKAVDSKIKTPSTAKHSIRKGRVSFTESELATLTKAYDEVVDSEASKTKDVFKIDAIKAPVAQGKNAPKESTSNFGFSRHELEELENAFMSASHVPKSEGRKPDAGSQAMEHSKGEAIDKAQDENATSMTKKKVFTSKSPNTKKGALDSEVKDSGSAQTPQKRNPKASGAKIAHVLLADTNAEAKGTAPSETLRSSSKNKRGNHGGSPRKRSKRMSQ